MRLAVVDLTSAPSSPIAAKLRGGYELILLALPLADFDGDFGGRPRITHISSVETGKRPLLRALSQLFAYGAQDAGPRTPGAACSFAAAADYSLFMGCRFPFVLLNDIAQSADLRELRAIDLYS